jgi:hypothetical protein
MLFKKPSVYESHSFVGRPEEKRGYLSPVEVLGTYPLRENEAWMVDILKKLAEPHPQIARIGELRYFDNSFWVVSDFTEGTNLDLLARGITIKEEFDAVSQKVAHQLLNVCEHLHVAKKIGIPLIDPKRVFVRSDRNVRLNVIRSWSSLRHSVSAIKMIGAQEAMLLDLRNVAGCVRMLRNRHEGGRWPLSRDIKDLMKKLEDGAVTATEALKHQWFVDM